MLALDIFRVFRRVSGASAGAVHLTEWTVTCENEDVARSGDLVDFMRLGDGCRLVLDVGKLSIPRNGGS